MGTAWTACKTLSFYNKFAADFCSALPVTSLDVHDEQGSVSLDGEPYNPPENEESKHIPPLPNKLELVLNILLPMDEKPFPFKLEMHHMPDFLQQPWRLPQLDLPGSLDLHQSTVQWLETQVGEFKSDRSDAVLFIYTDGSFLDYNGRSAWAIVICEGEELQTPPCHQKLLDWYAGPCQTDPDQNDFLGTDMSDSTTSEAIALSWAALYALAHRLHRQVVFCFDNLAIGQAAAGNFNFTSKYHIVPKLRYVHQAVESSWSQACVHHWHVKGHSSHPVNELANTLAQEMVKGWVVPRIPPLPFKNILCDDELLRHLWLHVDGWSSCQWPKKVEGELLCPPRSALIPLAEKDDWTFGYGQLRKHKSETELYLDLTIASHNVQSLKGKVLYYRSQAHAKKLCLLGLMEPA